MQIPVVCLHSSASILQYLHNKLYLLTEQAVLLQGVLKVDLYSFRYIKFFDFLNRDCLLRMKHF